MGISIFKIRENYNSASYKEFLLDTDDDLLDIPIKEYTPGCEAYSIESGKRFIVNNAGEWVEKGRRVNILND